MGTKRAHLRSFLFLSLGGLLPIAYAYAAYVILNLLLYTIRNAGSGKQQSPVFMLVYIAVAIGVSAGSAVLLYRRRQELV